jgi:hypothetical protein
MLEGRPTHAARGAQPCPGSSWRGRGCPLGRHAWQPPTRQRVDWHACGDSLTQQGGALTQQGNALTQHGNTLTGMHKAKRCSEPGRWADNAAQLGGIVFLAVAPGCSWHNERPCDCCGRPATWPGGTRARCAAGAASDASTAQRRPAHKLAAPAQRCCRQLVRDMNRQAASPAQHGWLGRQARQGPS